MHTIFLLVGRYASGKKTIAKELVKRGYRQLVSPEPTTEELMENDIYIAEPEAALFMEFELNGADIRYIVIYIHQSEGLRWIRAIEQGNTEEEIRKHFKDENEQFEFLEYACSYNYALTNNDLQKTVNFVEYIMLLETGEIV